MSYRIVALWALFLSLGCTAADPVADGAIRIRVDQPRGRTWILRADALYLRDHRAGASHQRFVLPGWIYLDPRYACEPDLLVEEGGTVLVSSNIVPRLWRVDPQAPGVVTLELALASGEKKDFGFAALRPAEPGVVTASGSIDRARWRIDLATRKAIQIEGRADCR